MSDIWTDRLSDYIDGELCDADCDSLERHLATCEDCSRTLAELRTVAARAAELGDRQPDNDLWAGVASRIRETGSDDSSVVDIRERAKSRRRLSFSVPQLLAAGIALMFVSAGSVWMVLSGTAENVDGAMAEAPVQGESAGLLASFDDPGYDAAVAELERLLEAGRDRLDSETVAVLERSLATINQAIAEARAALQSDPTNFYLSEHLSTTMNQKVRLLRQAVRLATSAS